MIVLTLFHKIDNTPLLCHHPLRERRLAIDWANFKGLLLIRSIIIFLLATAAAADFPLAIANLCSHLPGI